MKPLHAKIPILLLAILLPFLLISCDGSGGSNPAGVMTGTLELGLTDAAGDDYQAVYVTIAEVQVNKQDGDETEVGWQTIMTPEKTFDLLELRNGVIATLGVGELEAARYGQLRLVLGELPVNQENNILGDPHPYANYLIDGEGNSKELKVPSGYQSGIKINRGFTVYAAQTTELTLDFDAKRSIVQKGNGSCSLKPTIKVLETLANSVQGLVDDGVDPIAGATISAQVYTPAPVLLDGWDPLDEVSVEATTVSTLEGAYKLYLQPDLYNIVATGDGYLPACHEIEAQYYEEYEVDFSLAANETVNITINGEVTGLAAEDGSALLSIRRTMDCGSGEVMVEVASSSLGEGGIYSFILPAGTYELVAAAAGKSTQVYENISADREEDITF